MTDRTETIVWRKHPFVLLSGIAIPTLQLILLVFLTVIIQWLSPRFYAMIGPTNLRRAAIVIGGIWTALHLKTRLVKKPAEDATTPLARRKSLLDRIVFPWRPVIIISSIILVVVSTILLVSSPLFATVLYCGFLILWFIVETVDWWNDVYILTEDRIMDIVRVPILYMQRTEAPLAMVQNVTATTTLLGGILGYGNVEIETAGWTRAIIFEDVWNPHGILPIIFDRIEKLKEREQERQRKEQAEDLLSWFDAYHDLTSMAGSK